MDGPNDHTCKHTDGSEELLRLREISDHRRDAAPAVHVIVGRIERTNLMAPISTRLDSLHTAV
jgi:hypothetical protein